MTGPAELKWIAVDLDGTLAKQIWPSPGIGDPIYDNLMKVDKLSEAGWKVVIHTSRAWESYEAIEKWLNWHCIPWSRIVCGKLLAHRYVDDRNVDVSAASWLP